MLSWAPEKALGRRKSVRDEEIRRGIASFPRWHYEFDLAGHKTPIFEPDWAERHRQRKGYFFDPLVGLFGGSLAGKRVLDLGCNAGFWSLCAAEAGCEFVLGVDGRQMHVDQAGLVFRAKGIEEDRYDFVAGNIFETDLRQFGTFDIVLCLGLMYHVGKPLELMERIDGVGEDVLVVDTTVLKRDGPFFRLKWEALDEPRNAVDHELVMVPSGQAVRDMAETFGYSVATLRPDFRDEKGSPEWRGSADYRDGRRRAFLCAKKTNLSGLPDATVEAKPETPAP